MDTLENVIMGVSLFGSVVLVIYILARYNYLIKKAIAENGGSPGAAKSRYSYMDVGCIILSLGVGLGLSSVFTTMDLAEDTMDLLIYSTILICGGLGLMLAHYIRRKFGNE